MDGWTYTALDIVVERGLFGHGLWVMERSWWSGEEMRRLRLSKGRRAGSIRSVKC